MLLGPVVRGICGCCLSVLQYMPSKELIEVALSAAGLAARGRGKVFPDAGKKKCSSCDETKVLEEFHRDKTAPDGRGQNCKPCKTLAMQESRKRL